MTPRRGPVTGRLGIAAIRPTAGWSAGRDLALQHGERAGERGPVAVVVVGRVIVLMDHLTKKGGPRLLPSCTLPLTGRGMVSRVITDLCVLKVADGEPPPSERFSPVSVNSAARSAACA